MSIWTQSDFDSLKAAYLKLMSGEKVVQVSIGGKFVRYADIQIPQLKSTLNAMASELGLVVDRAFAKPIGRFD